MTFRGHYDNFEMASKLQYHTGGGEKNEKFLQPNTPQNYTDEFFVIQFY